jgi:25S rRNA (uracil2634-N3)-methyltransferase
MGKNKLRDALSRHIVVAGAQRKAKQAALNYAEASKKKPRASSGSSNPPGAAASTAASKQPSGPAKLPFKHNARFLLVGEGDFSFAAALADRLAEARGDLTSFRPARDPSKPVEKKTTGADDDEDDGAAAGEYVPGFEDDEEEIEGYDANDLGLDGEDAADPASAGGWRHIATSLDTEAQLTEKYGPAVLDRLASLKQRGWVVLHGVDAAKPPTGTLRQLLMPKHVGRSAIIKSKPTVVIFNFPHSGSGIKDKERNVATNRDLLVNFFAATSEFLARGGTVRVTLRKGEPYDSWMINKCAGLAKGDWKLSHAETFAVQDWPGYKHRRTKEHHGEPAADGEDDDEDAEEEADPNPEDTQSKKRKKDAENDDEEEEEDDEDAEDGHGIGPSRKKRRTDLLEGRRCVTYVFGRREDLAPPASKAGGKGSGKGGVKGAKGGKGGKPGRGGRR